MTAEIAIAEAKQALAPFTLDVVSLDWFTLYGIGQRMASSFVKDRVILVGDACHTHSSGSAQGLNTGTHDAVNLAWKLALVCKGLGQADVLINSYDQERRSSVQQVIDNDAIIATLISGNKPPKFQGREESPRELLTEWFDNAKVQAITLGLGISYELSTPSVISRPVESPPLATVKAGERGPDATLVRLGTGDRVRLYRILRNTGKFHLVIFAGQPHLTAAGLQAFHTESAELLGRFSQPQELFTWTTIIAGHGISGAECLGQQPWGMTWFDASSEAHTAYGIDIAAEAVVVLRPDGHIATVVGLQEQGSLVQYFEGFLLA